MLLLVGLGNPGNKYFDNRHNVGFMAIDEVARRHGFSAWRSKFQAQVADGLLGSEKTLIVKPQTFMNNSGQSVREALRFYRLSADDVIVLYDEVDLAPGKIRAKTGGGHAGHNGIRDIERHIGKDFHRVRIGVGHPGDKAKMMKHVLSDFTTADDKWLDPLLDAIAEAAPLLAQHENEKFMTRVALLAPAPGDKNPENEEHDDGI
ncbi:MAG: aminoacyl-tRNA hydrolase [Proteobacteria bacterium]|nr:aminoacyl-tRNA hydrolase [Pseudomonadota bacterium]